MTCGCGADLPGRRRVCDDCKKLPADERPRDNGRRGGNGKRSSGEDHAAAETGTPPGLRDRGRKLWDSLAEQPGTPRGAIALEACRIADRLDELDRIIAGKGVLDLMHFRTFEPWWDEHAKTVTVQVKFDNVLSLAATLSTTMAGHLARLDLSPAKKRRPGQSAAATATQATGQQPSAPAATPLDEVTAKRRQRRPR